jgi:regulator of replication initiation timing
MKVLKLMVCGIDCRPGNESCNGYCLGQADKPRTYVFESVERLSSSEEQLRITVLEQQLRAEKAGYSLLYEVKEQLRRENQILRDALSDIIEPQAVNGQAVDDVTALNMIWEIAEQTLKAADAVRGGE